MSELPELPGQAAGAEWRPPSPLDVARYLGAYSRELDQARQESSRLGEEYAQAKAGYRVAYARAYLSAVGTIKDRENKAVLETQDELLNLEILEQRLKAARERVDVLETQIRVGQSISALLRSEMGLAGFAP